MKHLKRTILAPLAFAVFVSVFRGPLYRQLVTYRFAGLRDSYPATDEKLIELINASGGRRTNPGIQQIIKLGLSITSQQLEFTADKNDTDPNKLMATRRAHCVGYASFFATTCNQLLEKFNLAGTWIAKPQAGQMYLLGINIHQYFNSPFFREHDFVIIENKVTGQVFAVDPTLSDYLRIDLVTYDK